MVQTSWKLLSKLGEEKKQSFSDVIPLPMLIQDKYLQMQKDDISSIDMIEWVIPEHIKK